MMLYFPITCAVPALDEIPSDSAGPAAPTAMVTRLRDKMPVPTPAPSPIACGHHRSSSMFIVRMAISIAACMCVIGRAPKTCM